jgi:hypothetical protein
MIEHWPAASRAPPSWTWTITSSSSVQGTCVVGYRSPAMLLRCITVLGCVAAMASHPSERITAGSHNRVLQDGRRAVVSRSTARGTAASTSATPHHTVSGVSTSLFSSYPTPQSRARWYRPRPVTSAARGSSHFFLHSSGLLSRHTDG